MPEILGLVVCAAVLSQAAVYRGLFRVDSGITTNVAGRYSESPIPIQLETALRLHKRRDSLFVDVRSVSAFNASHIPDAISIPANALDVPRLIVLLKTRTDVRNIVLYCQAAGCGQAATLDLPNHIDRALVRVYVGGFSQWSSLDLPLTGRRAGP